MTSTDIQQWVSHPELLNRESLYELRNLLARYPYFQSVRLLYLKNLYLLHDINFGLELRKAALYVADRRVLFYLIEGDKFVVEPKKSKEPISSFVEEEPSLDRTLSLIDAFLSTIPEETSQSTDFDLSSDYTSYLLNEEEAVKKEDSLRDETPQLHRHELIDGFIEKATGDMSLKLKPLDEDDEVSVSPPEPIVADSENDEDCFTETLAKIYIKQQRYSKALEIIKKLSLKYPKKNAYFADQIRFLEKLIINAKSK